MIKIEKKDTIIDIIEKIKFYKWKNLTLKFPFWHPILHNYISLKILKNKSWKKNITIITGDLTSRKIWKQLWIKYSIIKDRSFIKENEVNDLLKYNFTFIWYFKFIIKKYVKELSNIVLQNREINKIWKYTKKYESKYNIWFFIISLIVSVLLFLFIFYFAVNKTYVYITPEITIKTKAKNFIFKESINNVILKDDNIITIKPFSSIENIEKTFITTWIDHNSIIKSKWEVIFINNYEEEIKLLPNTRLLSKKWLLYETKNWTVIPAATKDNFWKIVPWIRKNKIVAKDFDINWYWIWNKWNIWWNEILTLPWLKSKKIKLYAKTFWKIKWWKNNYQRILLKKDIENAKIAIENELKTKALKKLKENLKKENNLNNTNWEILLIDDIIKYSNLEIKWIKNLKIWNKIKNFIINWKITIKTYIYNKNLLENKLKNIIRDSIIEWSEKILSINNKSLRVSNIIYKKNKPFEVKATTEVEFLILHDFSNNTDEYTKKLKNHIRWIKKEEAKNILINEEKISNANIKIRPFFINNISNITDNIIFKVVE